MKNKKKYIFSALSLVIILIAYQIYSFAINWYTFKAFENKINSFINTSDILDKNNVSFDKYCQYGHYKYKKSTPGCIIEASALTKSKPVNESEINKAAAKIGWRLMGSNLDPWKKPQDNYFSSAYQSDKNNCYISLEAENNKKDRLTIGCFADAKREWFPVREN